MWIGPKDSTKGPCRNFRRAFHCSSRARNGARLTPGAYQHPGDTRYALGIIPSSQSSVLQSDDPWAWWEGRTWSHVAPRRGKLPLSPSRVPSGRMFCDYDYQELRTFGPALIHYKIGLPPHNVATVHLPDLLLKMSWHMGTQVGLRRIFIYPYLVCQHNCRPSVRVIWTDNCCRYATKRVIESKDFTSFSL